MYEQMNMQILAAEMAKFAKRFETVNVPRYAAYDAAPPSKYSSSISIGSVSGSDGICGSSVMRCQQQ